MPAQAHKLNAPQRLNVYFQNTENRRHDRENMVGKSVSESIDWLQENYRRDKFCLWIDMWDPHEPFDPPDFDWARYLKPEYSGDRIIYPTYGRSNYMSPEEFDSLRALYAGKVTMVDRWIGRLMETIESLHLLKNTLIIWTTDHGHLFGEHERQGKPSGELGNLYEETTHIPLLIRHPQGWGAGKKISGLVQPPDVIPTILDFLEIPVPDFIEGKSVWPLVNGTKDQIRECAFSGRLSDIITYRADSSAEVKTPTEIMFDGKAASRITDAVTITSGKWTYICSAADRPSELYDISVDPQQQHNVIEENPAIAKDLRQKVLAFMEERRASPARMRP
ncbi:MAG: sulfatase-like hydrolase/transferase, partial [Desulfatiglandales bacterium]|nr:sulfatase-like hydrolase/transferase [Desulfatiglandales bacterium]